jgi:hypothetical protein
VGGEVPGANFEMALFVNVTYAQLLNPSTSGISTPVAIADGGTGQVTAYDALDALTVIGANIASAATTDIGAATGECITITGAIDISSFGTVAAGVIRVLTFQDTLTITYNATSMILPGGVDLEVDENDVATMLSLGAGNWRLINFEPYLNPQFVEWTEGAALALTGLSSVEWTELPEGLKDFEVRIIAESVTTSAKVGIRVGEGVPVPTYITTYTGVVDKCDGSGKTVWTNLAVLEHSTSSGITKQVVLRGSRLSATRWALEGFCTEYAASRSYISMGYVDVPTYMSAVKVMLSAAGNFDAGTAYIRYR